MQVIVAQPAPLQHCFGSHGPGQGRRLGIQSFLSEATNMFLYETYFCGFAMSSKSTSSITNCGLFSRMQDVIYLFILGIISRTLIRTFPEHTKEQAVRKLLASQGTEFLFEYYVKCFKIGGFYIQKNSRLYIVYDEIAYVNFIVKRQ